MIPTSETAATFGGGPAVRFNRYNASRTRTIAVRDQRPIPSRGRVMRT
jgi:hypothetical protein